MKRTRICSTVALLGLLFNTNSLLAAPSFSVSEHQFSGDQLKIRLGDVATPASETPLTLSNGLSLTYGQIMMLGDFYGLEDGNISGGGTDQDREVNFKEVFNSFTTDKNTIAETNKITAAVKEEKQIIDDAVNKGESPHAVYARINMDMLIKYNCITGGGCTKADWWINQGRYVRLAEINYDHFGESALSSYQAGHALALQEAFLARQTHDITHLQKAYALNAFASHFLADVFSTGHARTPRVELAMQVVSSDVSSILAHYMHDEEDKEGLHVHNKRGDRWVSYGDQYYFEKINQDNVQYLQKTLQASIDEIDSAYRDGGSPSSNIVLDSLPIPDTINNAMGVDIAPMFYWDDELQTLMRRQDLTNVNDHHWTADWWGWSTVIILKSKYGLSPIQKAILLRPANKAKATELGLIGRGE